MNGNLIGNTVRTILFFILLSTAANAEYVERPYSSDVKGKTRLGIVYFANGSYEISGAEQTRVKKIAHMLEIYHNYDNSRRIKIVGYADNEGGSDFNLHLGLARAEQLARALDDYGIVMKNAVIASYGESKDGFSEKNYRRAEVWLEPDSWGIYGSNTGLSIFFGIAITLLIGFFVYWKVQTEESSP
ncbi:MAG: OmpA family protein [Leptospirales bacterium]